MAMMRAIRVQKFGPPDVLKVEEVPVPKYGNKDVLVRVFAAGVNPVEAYIRSGVYPRLPQLPFTPGCDAAGIIEAVGSDVKKFQVGQRVFCTKLNHGSYAEYCAYPEDSCWILPQRITYTHGAAIGTPYFTAYHALFQKAKPRPADSILIHGASGAVGLAAVQLAKAFGMTIYGTAGTDVGLKLVKENGAHTVFNHRHADYTKEIMTATNGQGVDVILEMLSNVNLDKDFELVKKFGTIVVVGSRGKVEINPRSLMDKDATIVGLSMVNSTAREWADIGAALTSGFENGTLTPVVDKVYPLEKAADAHKDVIENSGAKGNLILNIEQRL